MVGKKWHLIPVLLVAGCSGNPAKPAATILDKKAPSEWHISDVRYQPERTIADPTAYGKDYYWEPTKYQPDGEEKLIFELKSGGPKLGVDSNPPKIQLIGIPADMAAVREMSRHLVSAVRRKTLPVAKYGFGPFGVSNDLYFGHTFWDMDVWVLPAMLFLAPDAAKSMATYRLDRSDQAIHNFGPSPRGTDEQIIMKFPWESSVTGKEVCVAKTKLQEHISGDVVWGLTQAEAMGIIGSTLTSPISKAVDGYYQTRSTKTARGLEMKDVTSPNEKFTGDNDLYTNLLAEWIHHSRTWKQSPTYYLPKDAKSFLNYDNDPLRDYQQVAGLLSIYPLQYPPAEKQAEAMLNRFESGLSPYGPAMGHSIIATIWARLGRGHKAYQAWKQSWAPYMNGPNNLFSERKNVARSYFYTGAAGAMNTVIYGFAGFRIDRVPLPGALWKKKMKSGWWLSCKPCVPGEIGKILLNGIAVDDEKYDFIMSSTGEFSAKISALKG